MKLIIENIEPSNLKPLTEEKDNIKKYYLEGIYMTHSVKNGNGRVYLEDVLVPAVDTYVESHVKQHGATGELGHPESPSVIEKNVSHLITELRHDGNNVIGKCKILDTPNGKIVKNFIDEGVRIGMSSRGLGDVSESRGNTTVIKYILKTVDIVFEPSASDAFVRGIMENVEWYQGLGEGVLTKGTIDNYKKVISNYSIKEINEHKTWLFQDFLNRVSCSVSNNLKL